MSNGLFDVFDGHYNFWTSCLTIKEDDSNDEIILKLPFKDINKNYDDENFLKNIIKNDFNTHRRAIAVFLLYHLLQIEDYIICFFQKLCIELGINRFDRNEISHDLIDLEEILEQVDSVHNF